MVNLKELRLKVKNIKTDFKSVKNQKIHIKNINNLMENLKQYKIKYLIEIKKNKNRYDLNFKLPSEIREENDKK